MPYRYHVTVEKRLLLYLMEFIQYNDRFEVPLDITQEGIAGSLGIRQHHVSRAISSLEKNGMVYERSSHIRGRKRRRKAYFLSPESLGYIDELTRDLSSMNVTVKMRTGELRNMAVSGLSEELARIYGSVPTPFELMNIIISDGRADLGVEYPFLKSDRRTTMVRKGNIPVVTSFMGRDDELHRLGRFLKGTDVNILAIYGLAGIGKTTLVAKLCNEERERSVLWYACNEWTSAWHVLEEMASFGEQLEADKARDRVSEKDVNEWIGWLASSLGGHDILLILDDVHKLSREAQGIIRLLIRAFIGSRVHIIMLARYRPRLYSRRDALEDGTVSEMELKGIDINTARSFMRAKGLDDEMFRKIYAATRGHPLALKLLGRGRSHDTDKGFMDFLEEEVLSDLNAHQLHLLKLVTIFRQPVFPDEQLLDDLDYQELSTLRSRFILQGSPDGRIGLHDALCSLLNRRIDSTERRKLHGRAVIYYTNLLRGEGDHDIGPGTRAAATVEKAYHQLLKGDHAGAYRTLRSGMGPIMEHNRLDAVHILQELARTGLGSRFMVNVHIMAGDLLFLQGELGPAKREFQLALKALKKHNAALEPERGKKMDPVPIYSKLGRLTDAQRDYSQSVKHIQASLKIFRQRGDRRGTAKALNNLGLAFRNMGDTERSIRYYRMAIKVLRELDERKGLAMTMTNIADVHLLHGEQRKAHQYLDRALDTLKDMDEPKLKAEVLHSLAHVRMEEGQDTGARMDLLRAMKFREKSGDIGGLLSTSLDLARMTDDPLGRIEILEEVLGKVPGPASPTTLYSLRVRNLLSRYRSGSRGVPNTIVSIGVGQGVLRDIATAYGALAHAYARSNRSKASLKASKAALKIDVSIPDWMQYGRDLLRTGGHLLATGDLEDARKAFETSRSHLEALGDREGASTALAGLARAYLAEDRRAAALKYLDLSMKAARECGYDAGIERARELIRRLDGSG